MLKILKVLILLSQYSILSATPIYQSSVTKVLPQKPLEPDESDYKYFIMQNGNWTWTDKFVMNSKLIRPLWIDAIGEAGEQEMRGKYEPEQLNDPSTHLWLKKHKTIGRFAELGVDERKSDEPENHEVIVDETEHVWTKEEAIAEEWTENGWTTESLPEGDEPKVVRVFKREMTFEDHLRPERGIQRSAIFEDEKDELDHFPGKKQMTWISEVSDNILMDKSAKYIQSEGERSDSSPSKVKRELSAAESAALDEENLQQMIQEQKQMAWEPVEEIKSFPSRTNHKPLVDEGKDLKQITPALPLDYKSSTTITDDEKKLKEDSELDKTAQEELLDDGTSNRTTNAASVESSPPDVSDSAFDPSTGNHKTMVVASDTPLEKDSWENIHLQKKITWEPQGILITEPTTMMTMILTPESKEATKILVEDTNDETSPEEEQIPTTTPVLSPGEPGPVVFSTIESGTSVTPVKEENIQEQTSQPDGDSITKYTTMMTVILPQETEGATKNGEEETVGELNPEDTPIAQTTPVPASDSPGVSGYALFSTQATETSATFVKEENIQEQTQLPDGDSITSLPTKATVILPHETEDASKNLDETTSEDPKEEEIRPTTPVPSSASLMFHEIACIFSLMSWTVAIFKVC